MKGINHRDHEGHRGRRGGRRPTLLVVNEVFSDPITRAIARNRDLRQAGVPERDSVFDHVFRCVCCGKVRSDEERQGPRSQLCLRCVQDAGFFN
jgi:hypothetical protein